MSLQFNVSLTPSTGSVAMYNWKAWLITQGWTVPRSSDGTTYNSTGDQITGGGSGAHGLANNSAWFVIQMPLVNAVNRQFCFQRGTDNQHWRIKYSFSAGFTGGSPGATQTPSATDEEVLCGAGTDAAPSFYTMFQTDGIYRQHMAADNASPYGCWNVCVPIGVYDDAVTRGIMMVDPMASGTYPSADADPYVLLFSGNSSGCMDSTISSTKDSYNGLNSNPASPLTWLNKGGGNQGFVPILVGVQICNGQGFGYTVPLSQSPFDAKYYLLPVWYGRDTLQSAPQGYKGISSLMKVIAIVSSTYDLYTVNSTNDKIAFGFFAFDWNGTSPLV